MKWRKVDEKKTKFRNTFWEFSRIFLLFFFRPRRFLCYLIIFIMRTFCMRAIWLRSVIRNICNMYIYLNSPDFVRSRTHFLTQYYVILNLNTQNAPFFKRIFSEFMQEICIQFTLKWNEARKSFQKVKKGIFFRP